MKIIYCVWEAEKSLPDFEKMSEAEAIAAASSNEKCKVYDSIKDLAADFNNGDIAADGYIFPVGNPETRFSDEDISLIKESLLCKIRQDARAAKQISISQAIALIEAEKQKLIDLLNSI